ncbi:MAG TPA: hypothetical protein VFJ16_30900 [Longimicrobium sp.]|nr:hypothetical protein [Longimicrobium sp.]
MRALIALIFLLATESFVATSQARQPIAGRRPTRVPVMLVLVDTLPVETPYRILRRAELDPRDVIVLRTGADSVALSAAVWDLIVMRQAQGDTATAQSSGMMRVRRGDGGSQSAPRILPWASRVMSDLHHAAPREVAGVGTAPASVIWLPPQRRRGALP